MRQNFTHGEMAPTTLIRKVGNLAGGLCHDREFLKTNQSNRVSTVDSAPNKGGSMNMNSVCSE